MIDQIVVLASIACSALRSVFRLFLAECFERKSAIRYYTAVIISRITALARPPLCPPVSYIYLKNEKAYKRYQNWSERFSILN